MYAKLIQPKKHGKVTYDNTGSAARLTNYLAQEKAHQDKEVAFFGASFDTLTKDDMTTWLDTNVKGLRATEAKFYSLVLSPSADELTHIGNSEQALKAYTREVMERYANNFQLKDGRTLKSKDLVWGATIHQERQYRGTDKEVQEGRAKAGDKREGLQTHIHITASARDAEQKITLNPGGRSSRFSLIRWQTGAGMQFQRQFGYTEKLQAYTKHQLQAKQRDAFLDARRSERIGERVGGINELVPKEQQLEPARVQKLAADREYDKTFYRMLSRVEQRAQQGQPIDNAYQLLATGREQAQHQVGTKNVLRAVQQALRPDRSQNERTQNVGEKRGRNRDEFEIDL